MEKDNSFEWRLKSAIKAKEKSKKEICAQVGITLPALSQYLTGKREPGINIIVLLAKTLGVTSDYLLGLSPCMDSSPQVMNFAKEYGLRDSILNLFRVLKNSDSGFHEPETLDLKHVPDKYREFIQADYWAYVRGMKPMSDEQSFIYDVLENDKIHDLCTAVFYFQIARSYMRLFKDRYNSFYEVFSKEEKDYASYSWDNLSYRTAQYNLIADEMKKTWKYEDWICKEREDYHIDGIPAIYAEKMEKYQSEIKQLFGEIVDEACENFEPSHEHYFRTEKEKFIAKIKDETVAHKETMAQLQIKIKEMQDKRS